MCEMRESGVEWIGEIPSNWKLIRFKDKWSNKKEIAGTSADSYERLALTLNGVIKRPKDDSEGLQPQAFDGYQILQENDFVFKMIDLQNISTSRIGLSPYTGLVSPAYIRFSPKEKDQHSKFTYYFLMSLYYNCVYNNLGGDGVRSALNATDMGRFNLPWPDKATQEKISKYLDTEIVKVNNLIANVQAQIEKLKAYKQSVITEVVTKGLDPSIPMKGSGVDWIGNIPVEWNVGKLRYVATFHNGDRSSKYPSGTDIVDDGVMFVTSNNLGNIYLNTAVKTNKYITEQKYDELGGAKIQLDDIIFCLRGSVGKCSINKSIDRGTIASALVVIRPYKISPDYLNFVLQCPQFMDKAIVSAIGIGSLNLSAQNIAEIQIPIPPRETAGHIAEFLVKKCTQIEELISIKQQKIDKLNEYKKSLIYEYVTGKKAVAQ